MNLSTITCFKKCFDLKKSERILMENAHNIMLTCQYQSSDRILDVINTHIDGMLNATSIRKERSVKVSDNCMNECDVLFRQYLEKIKTSSNSHDIKISYEKYQVKRNQLNKTLSETHHQQYKEVIESKDDRRMWRLIDWSGSSRCEPPKNHPSVYEMSEHFQSLYDPIDDEEDINSLSSPVSIPITDDPITSKEIMDESRNMQKGGYDYPYSVLKVLVTTILPIILLLMNTIFTSTFPSKLAVSILSLIPKAGNLSLPTNYRGIQMQPLLAVLYDRILTQRLIRWVKISDEQTAFQKGKGTIDQIFLLRIIIGIVGQ